MISKWIRILSMGDQKRYIRLLLWFALDSVVATLPYGFVIAAIYVILGPIAVPGSSLDTGKLWMLVMVLALQAAVYLFIRMKSYIDSCCGMAGSMKKARIDIGGHLKKLPLGFFDNRDAGDLSTVLLRDFATIENLSNSFAPQIAVTVIRLLLSVVLLALFNVKIALALFITIPCALPFVFVSYKRMTVSGTDLMKAQQDAASGILEYVEGIQTLKAFNVAGEHFHKLKDSYEKQRASAIHMETKSAAPVVVLGRVILNSGIVITILTGGLLTMNLKLEPFYYIAFLVMTLNIYEPVSILFLFIADFARTKRASQRIEEIYREQPLPEVETADIIPPNNEICFEHVDFAYNDKDVLHDISFTCKENTITALVGPSGSGKTTVTRLIGRFWDVRGGKVSIGGCPVNEMASDDLWGRISMVFQDVYLFHDTIEANIKMGNEYATRDQVIAAAKKASCHEFIMTLPDGYDTIIGEGGSTLSGGEKQRISIARAFLKDTPIVLLDEATASLDPENEVLIQRALSELVLKKTVIIVAHRLQSVSNADQIIVLEDGCIAETGNHSELLAKNGLYAHLWDEQNRAGSWSIK